MGKATTPEEILEFAIGREREAAEFYAGLAATARSASMRAVLEQFAAEERGHQAKLEGVRAGRKLAGAVATVQDLRIGDYLVAAQPTPEMGYQDVLVVAMKREMAAFKLYSSLAERTTGELSALFLSLAQEEARHKLRFEIEYDEGVLTEN
jgi:rubrerythrin